MAKIVKFFNEQEKEQAELVEQLENLVEAAKAGNLKNVMFAGELSTGEVATGYCHLDLPERQYLSSHIQIDINFDVVRANIDQIIEFE